MAGSFLDRIKGQLQAAGKGAQKLSKVGQLKLDLMSAETKLKEAYRDLGKTCSNRFIDRGESQLTLDEPAITENVNRVKAARAAVASLNDEIEATRASD